MQPPRRILHDPQNMRGRQRLEIDLRAARPERGVDVIRIPRRRPDQHEVRGRALLEQLLDVGRHALVVGVVICRLKIRTLVLEHLEQLILQHLVHLANLVDEEDTAVRLRYESRLWLGDAAVRKVLLRPLINGVMHRAEQGIRHIARIPAQRRPVRLHEWRALPKR